MCEPRYTLADQGSPTLVSYDRAGRVRSGWVSPPGFPILRLLDRGELARWWVWLMTEALIQFMDDQKQPTWTMR